MGRKMLAQALDQAFNAGRLVGGNAQCAGFFLVLQGFTLGLLLCDDLQGCIRRVAAGLLALRQPLADDRVGGLAVENQEGRASLFCDGGRGLTLAVLEVGRIDDDGKARMQCSAGQLVQVLVGGDAGFAAVDTVIERLLTGWLAEQALAFDIRAQADGAQFVYQTLGYMAFAYRGYAAGDGE